METLAFIFSTLGLIAMLTSSLLKGKNMKKILILVFLGNAFVAVSYLLGGSGLNGAASCILGALFSIINYFFDAKEKPVPKWLAAIYGLSFVAVNIIVSFNSIVTFGDTVSVDYKALVLCVLAIFGTLAFVLCIGQKNGAKYRFWTVMNMIMWCIYDLISGNIQVLITHIIQLSVAVVGMIIHDRKNNTKTSE